MKRNMFKAALAVAFLAIVATSCKKESADSVEKLSLQKELATVSVGSSVSGGFINNNGSTTDPTTGWGTVDYDLTENTTGATNAYVAFDQFFNGNITEAASGYGIGYIDIPSTTVDAITLTDIPTGSVNWGITTFGPNSPNAGWYNYNNVNRTISKVANRYMVVSDDTDYSLATQVYVISLTTIVGTGGGPNVFATDVDFRYKRLK